MCYYRNIFYYVYFTLAKLLHSSPSPSFDSCTSLERLLKEAYISSPMWEFIIVSASYYYELVRIK